LLPKSVIYSSQIKGGTAHGFAPHWRS